MTDSTIVNPRVMIKLTPNQMVLLLNVYRGIDDSNADLTRGNYRSDMRYLFDRKLIDFDGSVTITPLGVLRVMDLIEPVETDVLELALCEQDKLVLRQEQLYRFVAHTECTHCQSLAREGTKV